MENENICCPNGSEMSWKTRNPSNSDVVLWQMFVVIQLKWQNNTGTVFILLFTCTHNVLRIDSWYFMNTTSDKVLPGWFRRKARRHQVKLTTNPMSEILDQHYISDLLHYTAVSTTEPPLPWYLNFLIDFWTLCLVSSYNRLWRLD